MLRRARYCGLLIALLAARTAAAAETSEAYRYRISWNGIPAARVTVTLTDDGAAEPAVSHVGVEILTNSFVDLFWSLRASVWADVDAATLRAQRFVFDRLVRGRPELTRVEVEPDGTLTGRYARPGRYRLIEVADADVLDPISAILRARRELPHDGQASVYEVFTGETRYRVALRRDGSETIKVPAGRFAAARIEPAIWRVESNRPEERVRRVTLWVAEAAPHIPLRIRSEVFIGAVYCDLTEATGTDGVNRHR